MCIKFIVFIVASTAIAYAIPLHHLVDKLSFNIGYFYGMAAMGVWSIVLMNRLSYAHNHEIDELMDKVYEPVSYLFNIKQPYVETDDNGRMFVAWSENGLERMIDFRLKYGDREIPEPMINKMLDSI
jgi:hypothetical protein